MQTTQRRFDTGVIGELLDAPYRFEFVQAARMIERWLAQSPQAPGSPASSDGDAIARQVRFRNTLSLAFPPSELESARIDDSGDDAALPMLEIVPAFFGLLGVQGALPLHYTERIAAHEHASRERAASAFLDLFTNRATALFYRAWKKYRIGLHDEAARERRYLPMLLSLAGVRDASGATLPHTSIAACASAARHRPMSAAYLQRTLSHYFGVPFEIQQFAGKWHVLDAAQLTMPGGANALLGRTARIGPRVWLRDLAVRLVIGPLERRAFDAFTRGQPQAVALERMLTLLAGTTLEYGVQLVLRREDIAPARLDRTRALGRDAFLCTRPVYEDRAASAYTLHAPSASTFQSAR